MDPMVDTRGRSQEVETGSGRRRGVLALAVPRSVGIARPLEDSTLALEPARLRVGSRDGAPMTLPTRVSTPRVSKVIH